MTRSSLEGQTVLVVEEEPLVALDLRMALEGAGARAHVVRTAAEAVRAINVLELSAAVVDWHPGSEDHRVVARALKDKKVPFLFMRRMPPKM